MAIFKTKRGQEILENVTLKNVKEWEGLEGIGLHTEFFLNGKKMGVFYDDANGGETDIKYISDAHQKEFEQFLITNNVAQLMFENGWDFLESVDKIDLHLQAENVINDAVNLLHEKKDKKSFEKKIEKYAKTSIVFGDDSGYRFIGFKGHTPLAELTVRYGKKGTDAIQKLYDEVKSELKDGEVILNKNLEELGIKL